PQTVLAARRGVSHTYVMSRKKKHRDSPQLAEAAIAEASERRIARPRPAATNHEPAANGSPVADKALDSVESAKAMAVHVEEPVGEQVFLAEHFLNRELSWLEFNARVLEEAVDTTNPLLERVKFLAIFSSNLDEFFMVRVSGLREQAFED